MVFTDLLHRSLHGGDGFRLVVFDTDQYPLRGEQVAKDGRSANDLLGTLAHQDIVAAHVGLALGAVDDQLFHGHACGSGELGVTGKDGTAETDDTGVTQRFAHLLGRQTAVIERRARNPLVAAVGLDDHGQRRQARGMSSHMLLDGQHGTGSRRVRGRRQPAVGAANDLSLAHLLTDFDERQWLAADALMQRHVEARRQRRQGDRFLHRRRLVRLRLDAALEVEESLQHSARLRRHAWLA
ncbi:MAG: hypothetical protein AW11_01886 [Candidatus Accumulibacter regalis]|uniref:Uncharacterized protein n=1 Tax=Accumulibacter regalis TaxID=522306 RepID=A0A011P1B8_ACCRE|nr:MAG: hypothetical protein AW11_01886 [Candidatus Accumulibacter regalis]